MPGKDNASNMLQHGNGQGKILPYRVFVAGSPCDIAVYSSLKSGSIAVGEYRGKQIEVRGADALNAAEAWTEAANKLSERNSQPYL